MKIPDAIINKAKGLIDLYGCHFNYLGKFESKDAYAFIFPEGTFTGFPFVYLYDASTDEVIEKTEFEALDLIDSCVKE